MKAFQNLPIAQKLLLPLLLMGALTFGTSLYALSQMRTVGDEYQRLLDAEIAATEAILRANGTVAQIGRTAFIMVGETDRFILDGLQDEIALAAEELTGHLAGVERAFPEFADELDGARTDFTELLKIIEASRQAILSGKATEGARNLVDYGDPRLLDGLDKLAGVTRALEARRDAAAGAARTRYADALSVTLAWAIGGTLLFMALALWLTVSGVSRPLRRVVEITSRLAEGDTGVTVTGADRKDEIGAAARAVAVFQRSMLETERMRAGQEAMKAAAEAEKRAALARLAEEFEQAMAAVVRGVEGSARRMRETAQGMHAVADRSSRQTAEVADAAERAAASIDTVAAAAEELSASIQEISAQVAESARIAGEAVEEAERSNATVTGLVEAASRIGDVVNLINEIAGQTNLLALNATIEAARAGEAGKGFAVVASEVKSLATQTAKATEDIAREIAAIQSVAGSAADAIKGVGGTIGRISEIVTTIAAAVEEQGAATGEIARSVAEVADNTKAVSATIGEVSQAGAETGGMAGDVLSSAEELVGESEALRAQVAGFVQRVRAG